MHMIMVKRYILPAALILMALFLWNCAASSAGDIPAKMGQTIFTFDCAPMAAVCGGTVLVVGGLIVAVVWCKCRGAKANSRRKTSDDNEIQRMRTEEQQNMSSLQGQIRDLEAQRDQVKGELEAERKDQKNIAQVVSCLQGLIRDLEAQRQQGKGELQRVKAEIEDNKRQLQSVEAEITERQRVFDNTEGLLRAKEKLLQAQWKLDETKKNIDIQIQNIEKVLGPIEIQVSKIN